MAKSNASNTNSQSKHAGGSETSGAYEGSCRYFIEHLKEGVWCFELLSPVDLSLPIPVKSRHLADSVCTNYNPAAAAFLNLPDEALLGFPLSELLPPDELQLILAAFFGHGCRLDEVEWERPGTQDGVRRYKNNLIGEVEENHLRRVWVWQQDISQQVQALEKLTESEKRLRRLSDNMLDLIFEVDLDGLFTYLSPTTRDLLGYSPGDLLGTSFFDIIHPEDRRRVQSQLAEAMRIREKRLPAPFRLEYRARHNNGQDVWVESIGSGLLDDQGNRLGAILTTRDVTERNRSEKLQKALYRISEAANTAQDMDALYVRMHQIVAELIPAKNLFITLYDAVSDSIHFPYFVDECEENIPLPTDRFKTSDMDGSLTMNIIRNGVPLLVSPERFDEMEAHGEVQSLGHPSLDWMGVPLKTSDGKIVGMLAVQTYDEGVRYQDDHKELLEFVSTQIAMAIENKRVQDALRESEARLRAILNAIPDLILLIDQDGRFTDFFLPNEMTNIDEIEDLMGKRVEMIWPGDTAAKLLVLIRKALQTEQLQVMEFAMSAADELRSMETRIVPCGKNLALMLVREITERKKNEEALHQMNEKLTVWVNELEQRNRESMLLNKMGDMLQSCLNKDEAYAVFKQYAQQLFSNHSGAMYILYDSRNLLEMVVSWGDDAPKEPFFSPDECWALRRGRMHVVSDSLHKLVCKHARDTDEQGEVPPYLCIPMIAHGDTIGLLHLRSGNEPVNRWETLATMVTEQVALALANLSLRDMLQIQSVRDPLTNLFNRRYLQETLDRELSRARRYNLSLGVVMADIDHFKRFNDTMGHDAGDLALQELGMLLQTKTRKEDVVCRYGGDEISIILPGSNLQETYERAEQLREAVRRLSVRHQGITLGRITMSFGVAAYPIHGDSAKELLQAADTALYRAKRAGRDRVEMLAEGEHPKWEEE